MRISKVFTDLPLAHDDFRPFGVEQFCTTCTKCAIHCPSQAIPFGEPTTKGFSPANHSGVKKWYIDPQKCYFFWAQNWMDCSRCVAVCPFNKPPSRLHDVVRFFIKRFPQLNRLWLRGDDLAGYGKKVAVRPEGFWESD